MKKASGRAPALPMKDEAFLPAVDVLIEGGGWSSAVPGAESLCRSTVEAALSLAAPHSRLVEVSVLLTDDAAVARLNREYREREGPTNVLSFPASDLSGPDASMAAEVPVLLGDVVIAFETTAAEAEAASRALTDHLRHLVVHGVLHLLGYDHTDDAPAERMEALEVAILARIGVEDPYNDEKLFVA